MIVDNEEFYEQEKPLSLVDIRCLIVILRQVTLTWIDMRMIGTYYTARIQTWGTNTLTHNFTK